MVFPATPLPVKNELLLNGVWTDVTSYTRGPDGLGGVTITRGYSGEQASLSPGTCAFTLDNTDNRFSNRNPTSPYYRLLGRNTQFRNSIDTGVVSARYLDASVGRAYDGATIWTADKGSLDIVGDIDIQTDLEAEDWRGRRGLVFASKYLISGNQRSWSFNCDPDGYLTFVWSIDGTSTAGSLLSARCPTPINPAGRISLRVQMDVNNGSGGWTCSFYQASAIAGPYTLIDFATGTGTTSIFSSSARIEIGTVNNAAGWNGTFGVGLGDADPFVGKIYRVAIRNGIGGTVVADMNPGAQAAGATTWVDTAGTPNTWTTVASAFLSSGDYRFWGELPSLPRQADTTVTDLTVPTMAVDIISRLTQGNSNLPLRSPVFLNLSQYPWDGYWPMEDGFSAASAAAYVGLPGRIVAADFETQQSDFLGSAGALSFSDDTGYASGTCAASSGTPTVQTNLFYFKFNSPPSTSTSVTFMNWYLQGGTAYRATFACNNTSYTISITDVYGNSLASVASVFGGVLPGSWVAMRLKFSNSGSTITWEWAWYQVGTGVPVGTSGTFTGTMARSKSWISWPYTGKTGLAIAHVCMGETDLSFTGSDFLNSTNAYDGEQWDVRARRLAALQGVPFFLRGVQLRDNSTFMVKEMGAQPLLAIVPLLQQCAQVAGGDLYAPRDKFGLSIASWEIEINRTAGAQPQFDYSLNHLAGTISPDPDDFLIENDVTLSQPDGQQFRYAKTTGSLNTQDPQANLDAVGDYPVVDAVATTNSDDLELFTRRRVLFGTWDEDRYPQVELDLTRAPFVASPALTSAAAWLDLTRAFSIVNPGAWLAVNQIDLRVAGYTETLGQYQRTLAFNTRPYGPWKTGIWGSSAFTTSSLWGAESTYLKTGVSSTATSITIETPDVYEVWLPFAGNFQIEIAGERMTVTAVAARTGTGPYDYVLTVTRSVNGVVKSLNSNEPVTVVNQGRWT
jgi:hypothetical protein